MKQYDIKFANMFLTPNYGEINYLVCTMEGLDKQDVRNKFYEIHKDGEIITTITEKE